MSEIVEHDGCEEQCARAMAQIQRRVSFRCMKCEGSQGYRTAATSKHRSLMQCTVCRHQTSPTFKTALDRSRWPRCAWFLAVYLFRLAKTGLSSLTQMRQHAFGDRTARMLQQTTRRAMNSKDVSHRPFLSGTGPT